MNIEWTNPQAEHLKRLAIIEVGKVLSGMPETLQAQARDFRSFMS